MKDRRLVILLGLFMTGLTCSKPTGPESIIQGQLAGQNFWFVSSNHYHLQSEYRANKYAYITILGIYEPDDTVTFVSAVGDTEIVELHPVNPGHGVMFIAEVSPYGAAIYLDGWAGASPHDGNFGIATVEGIPQTGVTIEAIGIPHPYDGPVVISAQVKP